MRTSIAAICALCFCAVLAFPRPSFAVYACGGQKDDCQCGADNPFPCCSDASHGTNHGNCTWWAWEQACCHWGAPALPTYGNANDWLNEAQAAGWPTGNKPLANDSIFVRTSGQYGHVGWVTSVDGSGGFCSSEQGCYSWYGVINDCHPSGYAAGFICRKGTSCSTPQPACTTTVKKSGETIIDDKDPCFTRHGNMSYWWEAAIGYAGHMWYTYATDDAVDDYGVWTLKVQDAGDYEVFAYIPENNATSKQAKYRIRHDGQDGWATVNQYDLSAVFTSLGTFHFSAGGDQYVRLDDATGEDYNTYKRKVGFDAIKLVPKGSCTPNASKTCKDGDVYWVDSCGNAGTKAEECDDGDPCTDDKCASAACAHADKDCSGLTDACNLGKCQGGSCVKVSKTGACEDGDPCTTGDACVGGTCTGTPLDCSGLADACNFAACQGGKCVKQPRIGGCDDGDPCTFGDACTGGACVGAPVDCSAIADACNAGACQGGACVKVPKAGPCDDGDACTVGDVCVQGVCQGKAKDCSALDGPCAKGTCAEGACVSVPWAGSCDDGDPCTADDVCVLGLCEGKPIDCSALDDACNVGTCQDGLCERTPVTGSCEDGNPCTQGDTCKAGKCMPGPDVCGDSGPLPDSGLVEDAAVGTTEETRDESPAAPEAETASPADPGRLDSTIGVEIPDAGPAKKGGGGCMAGTGHGLAAFVLAALVAAVFLWRRAREGSRVSPRDPGR